MIGVVRAAQNRQLTLLADARVGSTAGAQSYTIPAGARYLDIEMFGGGGGGGAGNAIAVSRTNYYVGGGGGGGGGYVHYGLTAFGGDMLEFTIGTGGTGNSGTRGISGGNSFLTALKRGTDTVASFSGVIAYGGFGGERSSAINMIGRGGTGGIAAGGNISNNNASNGSNGGLTSTTSANGGLGGNGGQNDENLALGNLIVNGGNGGIASSDTRAVAGENALLSLMGAGGGGGGYFKSGTVADAYKGATGGLGGIRIRVYG